MLRVPRGRHVARAALEAAPAGLRSRRERCSSQTGYGSFWDMVMVGQTWLRARSCARGGPWFSAVLAIGRNPCVVLRASGCDCHGQGKTKRSPFWNPPQRFWKRETVSGHESNVSGVSGNESTVSGNATHPGPLFLETKNGFWTRQTASGNDEES